MFPWFPKGLMIMELSALMEEQADLEAQLCEAYLGAPETVFLLEKPLELTVTFKVIVKISLSTH